MSIHHNVAIYNATLGETRICPACRHQQSVPPGKKKEPVSCHKCKTPIPPSK